MYKRLSQAFSLVELTISMIVVSCLTAAFAPVITKKLKNGNIALTQSSMKYEELIIAYSEIPRDSAAVCTRSGDYLNCDIDLQNVSSINAVLVGSGGGGGGASGAQLSEESKAPSGTGDSGKLEIPITEDMRNVVVTELIGGGGGGGAAYGETVGGTDSIPIYAGNSYDISSGISSFAVTLRSGGGGGGSGYGSTTYSCSLGGNPDAAQNCYYTYTIPGSCRGYSASCTCSGSRANWSAGTYYVTRYDCAYWSSNSSRTGLTVKYYCYGCNSGGCVRVKSYWNSKGGYGHTYSTWVDSKSSGTTSQTYYYISGYSCSSYSCSYPCSSYYAPSTATASYGATATVRAASGGGGGGAVDVKIDLGPVLTSYPNGTIQITSIPNEGGAGGGSSSDGGNGGSIQLDLYNNGSIVWGYKVTGGNKGTKGKFENNTLSAGTGGTGGQCLETTNGSSWVPQPSCTGTYASGKITAGGGASGAGGSTSTSITASLTGGAGGNTGTAVAGGKGGDATASTGNSGNSGIAGSVSGSYKKNKYVVLGGGGGASGGKITNMRIPQDIIKKAMGGKIVLEKGAGGAGGNNSNGSAGGTSTVKVYKAGDDTTPIWTLTAEGGVGGNKADRSGAYGGAATSVLAKCTKQIKDSDYPSGVKDVVSGVQTGNNVTVDHGMGGAQGEGANTELTANDLRGRTVRGGAGGTQTGGGTGGGGGTVNINNSTGVPYTSADDLKGIGGTDGVAKIKISRVVKPGNPGGGGGGGNLIHVKNLPVGSGSFKVSVGKGGAAGTSGNSGASPTAGGTGGTGIESKLTVGSIITVVAGGGTGGTGGTLDAAGIGGNGGTTSITGWTRSDLPVDAAELAGKPGIIPTGEGGGNNYEANEGGNGGIPAFATIASDEYVVGIGGSVSTYLVSAHIVGQQIGGYGTWQKSLESYESPTKLYSDRKANYGAAGGGGGGGAWEYYMVDEFENPPISSSGSGGWGQQGYVYIYYASAR